MKKFLKHTLALCLALCGVIALFGLTACTPASKDFTVSIQYEDGKGVEGVYASWCVMNDNSGVCINCDTPSNADGVITLPEEKIMGGDFADKSFHISLTGLPDGYFYRRNGFLLLLDHFRNIRSPLG